jgi:hypothetical protein
MDIKKHEAVKQEHVNECMETLECTLEERQAKQTADYGRMREEFNKRMEGYLLKNMGFWRRLARRFHIAKSCKGIGTSKNAG